MTLTSDQQLLHLGDLGNTLALAGFLGAGDLNDKAETQSARDAS